MSAPKPIDLQPAQCACGGNPIRIPHVVSLQVLSMAELDLICDEHPIAIHYSYRCFDCDKESAVKDDPLDAICEWNKMVDEAKRERE